MLDGKYVCDTESRDGFNKDIIHIEAENEKFPVELNYIHQYEYKTLPSGEMFTTMVS